MDYSSMGMFASVVTMLSTYSIVLLILCVVMIIANWKIYTKAGKPGWASIVPIYNYVVLFQIAKMSPWLILLLLVPIANVVVLIMLYVNLAKAFGKSSGFAIGLIFLNLIFTLILAFDDSKYIA